MGSGASVHVNLKKKKKKKMMMMMMMLDFAMWSAAAQREAPRAYGYLGC